MRWQWCLCSLCVVLVDHAVVATETSKATVGWLVNDRHGHFPDQRPPQYWNAETGEHILWKVRLPNWSNSSPIVIAGRVYVMAEPLAYAPLLLCLDADTGAICWQREVDPLSDCPEEEGDALREGFRQTWQWAFDLMRLKSRLKEAGKLTDSSDWDRLVSEARALGATVKRKGTTVRMDISTTCARARLLSKLSNEAGLVLPYWSLDPRQKFNGGTWIGMTYSTPASDGQRVWTWTSYNHYACYDITGGLIWSRRFPTRISAGDLPEPQRSHVANVTFVSRGSSKAWGIAKASAYPGEGHSSTTAIMVDGLWLCNAGLMLRALDADTGATVWQHPVRYQFKQGAGIPGVLRLQGKAYIISAGNGSYGKADRPGNEVIRLSDGKLVGWLPGSADIKRASMGVLVHEDVVINHLPAVAETKDMTIVAHRASVTTDGHVEFTELWRSSAGGRNGLWLPVLYADQVVCGRNWFELRTGKAVMKQGFAFQHSPHYSNNLLLADGVWMLSYQRARAKFQFYDLIKRRHITNEKEPIEMPVQHAGIDNEDLCRSQSGLSKWKEFGAGAPFAYQNRLYIRSHDYLWCIGKR